MGGACSPPPFDVQSLSSRITERHIGCFLPPPCYIRFYFSFNTIIWSFVLFYYPFFFFLRLLFFLLRLQLCPHSASTQVGISEAETNSLRSSNSCPFFSFSIWLPGNNTLDNLSKINFVDRSCMDDFKPRLFDKSHFLFLWQTSCAFFAPRS